MDHLSGGADARHLDAPPRATGRTRTAHPRIFPGYRKGERDFDALPSPLDAGGLHIDCWGIVWQNIEPGLDSIPVIHPLADWSALDSHTPPDPVTHAQFGVRD